MIGARELSSQANFRATALESYTRRAHTTINFDSKLRISLGFQIIPNSGKYRDCVFSFHYL